MELKGGDKFAIDSEVFTVNAGEKLLALSAPASRMAGDTAQLQFHSDEVGDINVVVIKNSPIIEPGVNFGVIYINDSTTASEFAQYLTEALNNRYADAAACAQSVEDDILTEQRIDVNRQL